MSEKPSLASRLADEARAFLRAGLVFLPIWIVFNTVGWAQYSIPSESMSPTLEVGDRVLVTKWAYGYSRFSAPIVWRFMPPGEGRIFASEPRRGDVVVFAHPRDGRTMIKRLIGLPGDTVELRGGRVVVNGYALEEPYLPPGADSGPRSGSSAWVLGPDQYFIMGDNRSFSQDSRMLGPVGSELIVGRALVVYWPFENRSIVQHAEYGIK